MESITIIPSLVSDRSIKSVPAVCVFVSVCLSVHLSALLRLNRLMHGPRGPDFNNISNRFEGQGHRSKVKVTRLKNVIFRLSDWLTCASSLCILCHII